MDLHSEIQDTESEAWNNLLELIDKAVATGSRTFAPLTELPLGQETEIVTLPASIAKLKKVEALELYGSSLVRLPPEIGKMRGLRRLDIYTSYRLHWLPYEITRCRELRDSRVSTRALYGNHKLSPLPPFPHLDPNPTEEVSTNCSVCQEVLQPDAVRQVWISLRVATDVFPLLVNACSKECILRLPPPATGYLPYPHFGGIDPKRANRSPRAES